MMSNICARDQTQLAFASSLVVGYSLNICALILCDLLCGHDDGRAVLVFFPVSMGLVGALLAVVQNRWHGELISESYYLGVVVAALFYFSISVIFFSCRPLSTAAAAFVLSVLAPPNVRSVFRDCAAKFSFLCGRSLLRQAGIPASHALRFRPNQLFCKFPPRD